MTKGEIRAALRRSMQAGWLIGHTAGVLVGGVALLGLGGVMGRYAVPWAVVFVALVWAVGVAAAWLVMRRIVRAQQFRMTEEHADALFVSELRELLRQREGATVHVPLGGPVFLGAYVLPLIGPKVGALEGLEGLRGDLPRLRRVLGARVSGDLLRFNALLNEAVEDLRRRFLPDELKFMTALLADAWAARAGGALMSPAAEIGARPSGEELRRLAERGEVPGDESMGFLVERIGELSATEYMALTYLGESVTYQNQVAYGVGAGVGAGAAAD